MADTATQIFAGNAARGMSLVTLHNGGGVGIGKAINGGFGLVLDGSAKTDTVIGMAMPWDVMGGVARRAWARNEHALEVSAEYNTAHADMGLITLPHIVDKKLIERTMG
jgi:urocanate hydratase